MKHLILTVLFLCLAGFLFSQGMSMLTVDEQTICTAVEDRMPVGADSSFSSDVGQLYCFTKISGAEDTTTISHVWYFNGEEKAKVELNVKSKNWRTWSSKRIDPSWIGEWRVEVVSAAGDVLSTKAFTITEAM
ncbi:MAG: DUF2914 domain-containing protein [Calditrichaceae bacterium]|jgi:hypothetical protein